MVRNLIIPPRSQFKEIKVRYAEEDHKKLLKIKEKLGHTWEDLIFMAVMNL